MSFQKVEVESNWGYWDKLGKKKLRPGEPVKVRWPDGTETREIVNVQEDTFGYQDHGHVDQLQDHKAYMSVMVRGHATKVYLRNTPLLLERE